jgi:transposase
MKRFLEGEDRSQVSLLPEWVEAFVAEDNPVRVIDAFVDELGLGKLGFESIAPQVTDRPSYHPTTLLKIYLYGYLNRVQSSRRLEREAQRNLELMWLTGRLAPDFKTIANFRKDNGIGIRSTRCVSRNCRRTAESNFCTHEDILFRTSLLSCLANDHLCTSVGPS